MENTGSEAIRMESASYDAVQESAQATPNKLAGVWLWIMFIIMSLTLLCTGVLVAWPVLTWLAARFMEM